MESIPFIVADSGEEQDGDVKGLFRGARDARQWRVQIPTDKLRTNLGEVTSAMVGLLDGIRRVGRFRLKEVTIQVEVSAEGGISLIGTSSLGGKGAISLKFEEPDAG